jgi:lipoprotein-releasing system permease protein
MNHLAEAGRTPAADEARPDVPPERHRIAPVFSLVSFAFALVGTAGAPVVALLADTLFSDRLALPGPLAAGLAVLSAVAWAVLGGALAARAGRRLAFYEVAAAALLLLAFALGPLALALPQLRGASSVLA